MVWSSSFVVDDAPDLRGFKVTLIRLRVRESKRRVEPEAEGFRLFFERSFVWKIHGRKR